MNTAIAQKQPGSRVLIAVTVIILIAVAATIGIVLLRKSGPGETVTLATASQPIGAVVCVAIEKGYFEKEGLQVVNQPYKTGKDALQAVIDGRADVCEVAETPVVFAVLRGIPLRIFASVAWSQKNLAIVGRRDRGIHEATDLKGKKMGVTKRTNGEFFLHQVLSSRALSISDVQIDNLPPDAMVGALTQGTVDAVATWNPYLVNLQKALGANAATFYDSTYVWTWNLVALPAYLDAHSPRTQKILRAVLRASDFIRTNPVEARAIVAARTGMDPAILDEIWGVFSFNVALENMLLQSLNDQANWAIESKLSDATVHPDFRKVIHTEALKELMPEAVTLRD